MTNPIRQRLLRWGLPLLLIMAILTAWQSRLLALGWHWLQTHAEANHWREHGVWLPYYRASIDGRAIDGVGKNASGLTWSSATRTLFTVINSPPAVAELNADGMLFRKIPIEGARDVEGITHVRDNVFVIADEREQQLYRVVIDSDTRMINVRNAPRLRLAIDLNRNLGFEGVSWDEANRRLLVSKEKSPMRVLEISGLPELFEGTGFDLQISDWKSPRASTLFMTDLASLSVHEATGHILLLRDESALIVKYTADGRPVSMLPMWRGRHGLSRRVPQAEGLAVGPNGDIFVISEPNLFYRFERTLPAQWATDRSEVHGVASKVSPAASAHNPPSD